MYLLTDSPSARPNRGLLLGATGNPVLYDGAAKARGGQTVLLHGLPPSL